MKSDNKKEVVTEKNELAEGDKKSLEDARVIEESKDPPKEKEEEKNNHSGIRVDNEDASQESL